MIGIHIKTKTKTNNYNEIKVALIYAKSIGCTHFQIFNENIEDGNMMKKLINKMDLKMVIHSPYVINLASNFEPHGWRTKFLLLEIENAIANGAIGIVIHMGKSMTLPVKVAYNNMYKTLELACQKIGNKKFDIYLETTAGEGTELCYKLEDLGEFFKRIKANPKMTHVKICLDTCHLFCAGYDLRRKKSIDEFVDNLDQLVGIERVGLMHINDSLNDFDTRKDRHSNIGEGYIGVNGLRYFYQKLAKRNIPGILETPVGDYEKEIKSLLKNYDK